MSSQEPRRRDAGATRARLLQAARRRFTVLGFERTTVREIAADAGVNVALISRYFGSKEGLYAAVLDESATALSGDLGPDERGGLEDVVDRWLAALSEDSWPEFGHEHPLMLLVRHAGTDPRSDRLRRDALRAGLGHLEGTLAALGDQAPGRPVRAELLLATFLGLNVVRALLLEDRPSATDPDALRAALRQVLGALGSEAPR